MSLRSLEHRRYRRRLRTRFRPLELNWVNSLSNALQPEDLLNNPGILHQKLFDAKKNCATLVKRKNIILAWQQDIKTIEAAEASARKEFADARTNLIKGYGETAIRLIQLYFYTTANGASNKNDTVKSIDKKKTVEISQQSGEGGLQYDKKLSYRLYTMTAPTAR